MAYRYFDERMETLPPDVMRTVQDHRLRWQFRRCWDGSPWYRERFEAAGLTPGTFDGLTDVSRLPLMSQDDGTRDGASDWRVAPESWVSHIFTLARPTARMKTTTDTAHESQRESRARAATALLPEEWLPSPDPHTRSGIFFSYRLQASARVAPYRPLSIEFVGHALAHNCAAGSSRHWADDHFLAEIVDPKTEAPLSDGAVGELIVTDLVREAYPLVRFRTGLKRAITRHRCPCGRTTNRIWTATQMRAARTAETSAD